VSAALGLADGAEVIRRTRVTLSERSGPVEVSTSWLDGALVDVAPALLAMDRIRTGTVSYVETMTGRKSSYARDQVAARLASDDERGALGLTDQNAAVLAYRHTVFDSNDAPLEFAEAVYPPDRWTFEQEYSVET
jgi:GntR family transcriptional regulator